MNDNKNAAKVLRQAAEYIGEHGWIQGDLEDSVTGSVCAAGALCRVAGVSNSYGVALDALTAYIGVDPSWIESQPRTFLHPVAKWNDAPERSAEDVILAMKRTAEELDRG